MSVIGSISCKYKPFCCFLFACLFSLLLCLLSLAISSMSAQPTRAVCGAWIHSHTGATPCCAAADVPACIRSARRAWTSCSVAEDTKPVDDNAKTGNSGASASADRLAVEAATSRGALVLLHHRYGGEDARCVMWLGPMFRTHLLDPAHQPLSQLPLLFASIAMATSN